MRFYLPNVNVKHAELTGEAHTHAAYSLRIRVGDFVTVFDGTGTESIMVSKGYHKRPYGIGDFVRNKKFGRDQNKPVALSFRYKAGPFRARRSKSNRVGRKQHYSRILGTYAARRVAQLRTTEPHRDFRRGTVREKQIAQYRTLHTIRRAYGSCQKHAHDFSVGTRNARLDTRSNR